MKLLILIVGCVAVSEAIVCTPQLCGMVKSAPLQCKGSVIKGGGFCGCTDACAKVNFILHSELSLKDKNANINILYCKMKCFHKINYI